jgi:hypothetical protein
VIVQGISRPFKGRDVTTSDVTTSVVVVEWIKRIADSERKRDAVSAREKETASRKARLVHLNGQRLIDELRATVVRDVEAFRAEFPGDPTRQIVVDESAGGFNVSKPSSPAVSLALLPNLDGATITCLYRFTTANGLPPREDSLELEFTSNGGEAVQIRHRGTGQLFPTANPLSEFLLVPVLTGRPR